MIFLLLVAAICITTPLRAEDSRISGRIIDRETGEALPHVSLFLEDQKLGTFSDDNGLFQLHLPTETCQLTLSCIGYQTVRLGTNLLYQNIEIALSPRSYQLEKVIVLGRSLNRASSNFNRYQPSSSSTEEALGSVEGVSLIRRGAFGQEPAIRGLSGGQVLLLVDGMRVHGACTDRMDPATSYVDLDALGEATLRVGAADTRDGATVGGSIDLHHVRQPLSDAMFMEYGAAASYADALSTSRGSAYLANSSSNLAWRVRASYQQAGDYRTPDGTQPFSGHEKLNMYGTMRYAISSNQNLDLLIQSDDAWDMGYAALPMDVGYARFRAGSVRWSMKDPANWLDYLSASLYHNRVDHWMDDASRSQCATRLAH